MSRASSAVVVSALVGLLAGPASADTARVRFLGSAPIGPLASVSRGALRSPHDRACRSWGAVGSRWKELDALGRVAGDVEVVRREYYDVSRCDELSVRLVRGHRGAGVYVDANAPYRPAPVSFWRPSEADLETLYRLAGARAREQRTRTFFFEWGTSHERFAAVGGRSLLLCAWRGGRWTIVHDERPDSLQGTDREYRPLAVMDMNGDGRPELVVHVREGSGEWYADETISMHAGGTWGRVAAGIYGSTA
jgi:hypothetical protein